MFQEKEASQLGKEYEDVDVICEAFAIPEPSKITWSVEGKAGCVKKKS